MLEGINSSTIVDTQVVKPLGIFGRINKNFINIKASIGGLSVVPIIFLLVFGFPTYNENISGNSNIISKLPPRQLQM